MQPLNKNHHYHPVVEQVTNNTTNWVGHRPGDSRDNISGQTFVSPVEGDLDCIEVYSSMVTGDGQILMTMHSFDPNQKRWGPVLGSARLDIEKSDAGKWISFNMPGLHLQQGKAYGFRLESHNTLIGVGEAAGSHRNRPYQDGEEWKFTNEDEKGHSFSYFSLAFKVDLQ